MTFFISAPWTFLFSFKFVLYCTFKNSKHSWPNCWTKQKKVDHSNGEYGVNGKLQGVNCSPVHLSSEITAASFTGASAWAEQVQTGEKEAFKYALGRSCYYLCFALQAECFFYYFFLLLPEQDIFRSCNTITALNLYKVDIYLFI